MLTKIYKNSASTYSYAINNTILVLNTIKFSLGLFYIILMILLNIFPIIQHDLLLNYSQYSWRIDKVTHFLSFRPC